MGTFRGKIDAKAQTTPKSNDDSIWLNDDAEVILPESLTSTGSKSKSSCLGNVAAFGVPFIAASVLFGFYGNSDSSTPSSPSQVESQVQPQSQADQTSSQAVDDATQDVASNEIEKQIDFPSETNFEDVVESESINDSIPEQTKETNDVAGEQAETALVNVEIASETAPSADEINPPEAQTDSFESLVVDDAADTSEQTSESDVSSEDELVASDVETLETITDAQEPISLYADPEETRQALAQLDYRLSDVKKQDVRDVSSIVAALESLEEEGRAVLDAAAPEVAEQVQAFLDKTEEFRLLIIDNQAFFNSLQSLDQASLDAKETREFFTNIPTLNSSATEITEYRQDLVEVATTLDAAEGIEEWNRFIETQSAGLEKFYVAPVAAQSALDFIQRYDSNSGAPAEFEALKRRQPEWDYKVHNVVATQRKIVLRLESEIAQKYWTYKPSADKCYYLSAPPKVGLNSYVASATGSLKTVEIPDSAPETKSKESQQTEFLRGLSARARQISDDLKENDVAQWYENWCSFLRDLQTTDKLDPIVQYVLFRDCVKLLSSGDYYFARRLEPIMRMLNAPQLAEDATIDRFRTDEVDLQKLRRLAESRVGFLPKDHLVVDKTTEQLDAQVEKISFVYRRVGWLDRDFSDVWRCRRPEDAPLPIGDLFVLLPSKDKNASSKPYWYKIGSSNGKQASLTLATSNVPRGSIIFCRVGLRSSEPIARRNGVEQFFQR